MTEKNTIVIDTSALIKFVHEEKNFKAVEKVLQDIVDKKKNGIISTITVTELLYNLEKNQHKLGFSVANYLENSPLSIQPVTQAIAKQAGYLKIKYRPHLSTADAVIIATAIESNANEVITSDKIWAHVPEINAKIV